MMPKRNEATGRFVKGDGVRARREEAALLIMRLEKLGEADPEVLITAMLAFWSKNLDIRTMFLDAVEKDFNEPATDDDAAEEIES